MKSEKFRTLPALLLCLCGIATAQSVQPTNRITTPIDESSRITLHGNVHPLAQVRFDRGPASAATPTGRIALLLQRSAAQQQALTQYLADLQNPGSPNYHKWLTPAKYGSQFGISDSDLAAAESWLQAHGFRIEKVPQARNLIQFSGTFGQVQEAFHTSIHTFQVNGVSHFANASDPQIPAALAPILAGVGPLNDFRPQPSLVHGPRGHYDTTEHKFRPDLTLQDPNGNSYLVVGPADAATIYDSPNNALNAAYSGTNYDGSGVSLGMVGVSNLEMQDITNYSAMFLGEYANGCWGGSSCGNVNWPSVVIDGNDPGVQPGAAAEEALLDNEVAVALAPKALMFFYISADTDLSSGLLNAIMRAVDENQASILSVSFAECEAGLGNAGNALINEIWQQAAAQGISVVVSAGDNGSAGCDNFDTQTVAQHGLGVNGFASTPWNIAVGGTDFDVLSSSMSTYVNTAASGIAPYYETAKGFIPEAAWNDSTTVNTTYAQNVAYKNSQGQGNIVAGSGGTSSCVSQSSTGACQSGYPKPAFETSLTPADSARDLPDISVFAGDGFHSAFWALCSDNISAGVTSSTYTDCQTYQGNFISSTTITAAGGTSAAAPAFAGMLALIMQSQDRVRLGQADYILYQLAKSNPSAFHDVTTGNNSPPCMSGSPNCGTNGFLTGYNADAGYDLATGLGSVDVAALANAWSSAVLTSTSTTMNMNGSTAPYTGTHGATVTFNVGVTPATATGVAAIVGNVPPMSYEGTWGPQIDGQVPVPLTNGAGTVAYNGLPGGSYKVWASYGGDASDAASTSTPIDVTIAAEPSTTTLAINAYDPATGKAIPNSNIPYGYYVIADALITGTAEGSKTQGVATGTVQFLNNSTILGSSAVSSGNQASWPPLNSNFPALPAGTYNFTAQYSGDPSYSASSAAANFTIAKAATTTAAGYAGTPIQYGNQEQITAGVSTNSYGVAPAGTFQFYVDGQPVLNPQPVYESGGYNNANGKNNWAWADAQTTYVFRSLGQHTLSASYSGDVNYVGSTSPATTITVSQASSTVASFGFVNTQQNPVIVAQSATGTATVFGSEYGVPPTGTITFYDGSVALTDPVTYTSVHNPQSYSELQATTQHVFTTPGPHQITVSYSGDTNYTSATSQGAQSLNVLGPVSVTPAGPLTISAPGQSGSVSLSVTPNAGFTGPVTLSCSVPPTAQETTCGFGSGSNIASTLQLTISGAAATANFSVTTTAQHQSAALSDWRSSGIVLAVLFVVIAPMRRWNRRLSLLVLAMGLILCQTSCSGGGGSGGGHTDPGTLPGTYSFTVTAASGSGASAYSTPSQVTVVVQ